MGNRIRVLIICFCLIITSTVSAQDSITSKNYIGVAVLPVPYLFVASFGFERHLSPQLSMEFVAHHYAIVSLGSEMGTAIYPGIRYYMQSSHSILRNAWIGGNLHVGHYTSEQRGTGLLSGVDAKSWRYGAGSSVGKKFFIKRFFAEGGLGFYISYRKTYELDRLSNPLAEAFPESKVIFLPRIIFRLGFHF